MKYDHRKIEKKWQLAWEKEKIYSPEVTKTPKNAKFLERSSQKHRFYNLWMFPYPSAEGLHAGHAFASTGSDIFGRYMRMNGKAVFQPIGYDSFGIHSENFAIKIGENPEVFTKRAISNYAKQFKMMGHGYDWTKTVTTSDINYYKWTQWLFLQMFKAGLAYKKKASVNFCPGCKTVLADEQIVTPAAAGKLPPGVKSEEDLPEGTKVCERCGNIPERRDLSQWFFKITKYADRLLSGLDKIDWSERVKVAQREWIGKKEGAVVNFDLQGSSLQVFTTRLDTIYGVTFMVLAPEKAKELLNIVPKEKQEKVSEYIKVSLDKTEQQRKEEKKEKTGVDCGLKVKNPVNGDQVPVWVSDYVLMDVGTGAVMGVPYYDERDRAFAEKFGLPIKKTRLHPETIKSKANWFKGETHYHLRDWLVSRQRYWGAPIPMIDCPKCGWQPVPENQLPISLPDIEDYKPEGTGKGPLANHPEFFQTKCPKCGGEATRETDVMDTFVDSSWYFLRYPSVRSAHSGRVPFDSQITKNWLPVDLYFGGAEHAVLHLMYSRFVTMVLFDLGMLDFEEPFPKFFAHGLMIKDGAKMSKSRGNVVNPDTYIEKFGADALRLYLTFMGPMDGSPDFRDTGIEGMRRFVERLWTLFHSNTKAGIDKITTIKLHQTIKKVTQDIQEFKYNTAIASIMELVNVLRVREIDKPTLKVMAKLIAPFAPHLAEEVWVNVLGQKFSVHTSPWPQYNSKYIIVNQVEMVIQVNGKVRETFTVDAQQSTNGEEMEKLARENEKILKWIEKGTRKVIFVPGKLINFVV